VTKALSELITKGFYPPKILSSIVRSDARDDLNKADSKGYTPLMHAVINGHDDLVRTLLAAGADPSAKNNLGDEASTIATQLGRSEMFKDVQSGGPTESEFRKSDGGSCDLLQRKLEQ
jgi:ankyrin repeat protein